MMIEKDKHQTLNVMVFVSTIKKVSEAGVRRLSRCELETYDSISNPLKKERYLFCRIFLRRILGIVIGKPYYEQDFVQNSFGKPRLYGENAHTFNLSHSKQHIAVACAIQESLYGLCHPQVLNNIDVGVDIEPTSRKVSLSLLDYAFTASEREYIFSHSDWNQVALRLWTAKEAVVKCIGCGLTQDLKTVTLAVDDIGNCIARVINGKTVRLFQVLHYGDGANVIGSVAINLTSSTTKFNHHIFH